VIDHVSPFECGGADATFNMQWQTVAEDKAKDEACGFKTYNFGSLPAAEQRGRAAHQAGVYLHRQRSI